MDAAKTRKQLRQIEDLTVKPIDPCADLHQLIFSLYRDLEAALQCANSASDELVDAQTRLMTISARQPAQSFRDVLFKLALWRWDAPNVDGDVERMARYDAAAYAAFADLAALLSEPDVLKDEDRRFERAGASSARPSFSGRD